MRSGMAAAAPSHSCSMARAKRRVALDTHGTIGTLPSFVLLEIASPSGGDRWVISLDGDGPSDGLAFVDVSSGASDGSSSRGGPEGGSGGGSLFADLTPHLEVGGQFLLRDLRDVTRVAIGCVTRQPLVLLPFRALPAQSRASPGNQRVGADHPPTSPWDELETGGGVGGSWGRFGGESEANGSIFTEHLWMVPAAALDGSSEAGGWVPDPTLRLRLVFQGADDEVSF